MDEPHHLAPLTEVLPPVQPVSHSRRKEAIASMVRGEDGQLYRLQPIRPSSAPRFEGLWIGLIFISTIGTFLLFLQVLKPAPQAAPVIVQPPPDIRNPNCIIFCR